MQASMNKVVTRFYKVVQLHKPC